MSGLGETRFGHVRGKRLEGGGMVYLGVPYAQCARWTSPEPLKDGFRYSEMAYVTNGPQAAQPALETFFPAIPRPDLILSDPSVGFSEDCLTLDIYTPENATRNGLLPVSIFIHGGFLQVGSPSCTFNEPSKLLELQPKRVYVNVTYRLSVFGFLAANKPKLSGNFGFQDQWQALLWVQQNINNFGGNPEDVTLVGQSAGAHSTQELLIHASRLPDGNLLPFQRAYMISNGISTQPISYKEAQVQFDALCEVLSLDSGSPQILERLRAISATDLCKAVADMKGNGGFRGVTDGNFVQEGLFEWQRTSLSSALERKGFKGLIIGETSYESLGGSCPSYEHLANTLSSMYGRRVGDKLLERSGISRTSDSKSIQGAHTEILSNMQVHLGSRLLVKALWDGTIPVVRYLIDWLPAGASEIGGSRPVRHGYDLLIHFYRHEYMDAEERRIVSSFLQHLDKARQASSPRDMIVLTATGDIKIQSDPRWDEMEALEQLLAP